MEWAREGINRPSLVWAWAHAHKLILFGSGGNEEVWSCILYIC